MAGKMAGTTGATAVAERPTDSLWLASLPRLSAAMDRLPATRSRVDAAEGAVSGLPGAVTDMVLSADGASLIAACYGADAVCAVDTTTLAVTAVVTDVAEPYAVAISDRGPGARVYVTSTSIETDSVVAVDLDFGVALADRSLTATTRGLAVAPAGDTVYIARCGDDVADIVAVDVLTGRMTVIPVARGAGATVDTVRISADGARLFATLHTGAGSALVVVDARGRRVAQTIAVEGSLGDIAVHTDGRRVLATGYHDEIGSVLTVIDASAGRVTGTVALAGIPTQVVTAGSRACVLHGDAVSVVDVTSCRVVDVIEFGGSGAGAALSCLAVNPEGTRLYVADYDGTVIARAIDAADPRLRAAS